MSGGRFLVFAIDVMYSENILKLKSFVQEGVDIDDSVKFEDVTKGIILVTHIACHIAYKPRKICAG